MKAKVLRQLLRFFKKKPVDSRMIKDKTKELLLSKSSMGKYKQGALRNVNMDYNPKKAGKYWDKWLEDSKKGFTPNPPNVTRKQYIADISKQNKAYNKFYNSKEFPIWYRNTVNKRIGDVSIKFVKPGHRGLESEILSGRQAGGVYRPVSNSILISKRQGNLLSTGVHEVKHAVQQGMFSRARGTGTGFMPGPEASINKLINKNLVKPPALGTDKRMMFNYYKDPIEVSARFEELRMIRDRGGIFANFNIRTSSPFRALKKIFGSSKKVLDLEKKIWGLAPVGITGGLLGNALEKEN